MRAFLLAALAAIFISLTPAAADFEFTDIACETTGTEGTGTLTLDGALSGRGYLSFSTAGIDSGDTVPYHIVNGNQRETGIGTFTDNGGSGTDTLARTTVQFSSDGVGTAITLDGTSTVCIGPIASIFTGGGSATSWNPSTSDGASLGTSSLLWSDLFLASGGVINWNAGDVTITHSANALAFAGVTGDYTFDDAVTPATNDAGALGSATLSWSDTFLADGGVINWGNGGVTLTHTAASDSLTIAADAAAGLASTQINLAVDGSTEAILNGTNLTPGANDGNALGASGTAWSDLFLASGSVINFNAGDVTLTHSSNTLTLGGGDFSVSDTFGLVVGHTALLDTWNSDYTSTPEFQFMGTGSADTSMGIASFRASASGPVLQFAKSRAASVGSYTIVNDGDTLGTINFVGSDGTNFDDGVRLHAFVDGTPGVNDIPGELLISTATGGTMGNRWFVKASGTLEPGADATYDIGTTTVGINDLHLGTAGEINWDNSDAVIRHNAGEMIFDDYGNLYFTGGPLHIQDEQPLRWNDLDNTNYKAFKAPTGITADTTCTFEDDANFIPDSCVGNGTDDTSDERLKENITLAGDVGALLDQIRIYDYDWKVDAPEISSVIRKGNHGFGPKAQELYRIAPQLVTVGGDDPLKEPWTWEPNRLVPYLLVEIQNLRKRVSELERD